MAELDSSTAIKRMPYSLEAEQALLGTVIVDSERFADIASLKDEDFYLEQHKSIFAAMREMSTKTSRSTPLRSLMRLQGSAHIRKAMPQNILSCLPILPSIP